MTANGTGRRTNKSKRPRGASGAAEETEGSIDDAGSDHADISNDGGKGKAKRSRNSAASRGGESPAMSVETDEGDGEFGDADDADDGSESSPELELRTESKEAYTIEELIVRLNLLYSKAGLTLDVGFYTTMLDERAKKDEANTPAEAPSSAAAGDGADNADAISRRGNGGAAAKGSGKRKAPIGNEEAPDSSARVANNKSETAATAADSSEPTQQPTAKRRKEDAADDGDDDFSCGGGGSGGEDSPNDFNCGVASSDSDDGSAPSRPSRPPSSRREGASKPALERARVRANLGKNKVGAAKLRDKIPTGAASGLGSPYLIPKKTAAAAPTAASGGGSAIGGGMRTIPKKPFLPTTSRWARPLGLSVQCSWLLLDQRHPY